MAELVFHLGSGAREPPGWVSAQLLPLLQDRAEGQFGWAGRCESQAWGERNKPLVLLCGAKDSMSPCGLSGLLLTLDHVLSRPRPQLLLGEPH